MDSLNWQEDDKIVELIHEAIKDESKKAEKYNVLAKNMHDKEDKEMLRRMRMECLMHIKLLHQVFFSIITQNPNSSIKDEILTSEQKEKLTEKNENLSSVKTTVCIDYYMAMIEELDDVVYYRKLKFLFTNTYTNIHDIMYEIISNKQSNATKLSYLYAKYSILGGR